MREIKFRAWDNTCKVMKYCDFEKLVYTDHSNDFRVMCNEGYLNNRPYPLMQFTGLKDKNGKEIYEGDILSNKDTDGNMVVNWCPISAGFCLDKKGWMFSHYFKEAVDANQCEVIGNIYENPELLNP